VDSVGVRELRNNVAAVLRRAAGGERLVVTVDGSPVAQLGPLEPAGTPTLEDLVATGLVEAPRRSGACTAGPEPIDLAVDLRLDDVIGDLRGRG
jgi:prevent-host-death family protein